LQDRNYANAIYGWKELISISDSEYSGLWISKEMRARLDSLDPEARRRQIDIWQRDRIDNEHVRLLLAFGLAQTSNCVDVGACYGSFIGEVMGFAPGGHHIAFEPIESLCEDLRRSWPRLDVRAQALGDVNGECEFVYVDEVKAYSGFREQPYPYPMATEIISVPVRRLDDCLPSDYRPDLIKIDVEGAEMQVLRGAMHTICDARPIIIFEYGRAAVGYGTKSAEIYRLLVHDAGLRIFDLDGGGPYSQKELEESRQGDARWNYVAHR
jgi:FkbM family methyltransferase